MPAAEADRPGKVFVGGLASDIDEAVLEKYFSHYGRLTEVIVKRDKNTQQTRGYAFITFENPYDAEDAIKDMDKKEIHGRQIYVEQAVKPRHETQNLRAPPRGGGLRGAPRGSRGGGGGRGGGGSRGGPRGRMGDGHMDRSRSPIRQRPDRGRSDRDFSRGGRDGFDGPPRRDLINEFEHRQILDEEKPWITPELLILVRQKDEMQEWANKCPSLAAEYRKFRNHVRMKVRKAKIEYEDPTGEKRDAEFVLRKLKKGMTIDEIEKKRNAPLPETHHGGKKYEPPVIYPGNLSLGSTTMKLGGPSETVSVTRDPTAYQQKAKFENLMSQQSKTVYESFRNKDVTNSNWSEKQPNQGSSFQFYGASYAQPTNTQGYFQNNANYNFQNTMQNMQGPKSWAVGANQQKIGASGGSYEYSWSSNYNFTTSNQDNMKGVESSDKDTTEEENPWVQAMANYWDKAAKDSQFGKSIETQSQFSQISNAGNSSQIQSTLMNMAVGTQSTSNPLPPEVNVQTPLPNKSPNQKSSQTSNLPKQKPAAKVQVKPTFQYFKGVAKNKNKIQIKINQSALGTALPAKLEDDQTSKSSGEVGKNQDEKSKKDDSSSESLEKVISVQNAIDKNSQSNEQQTASSNQQSDLSANKMTEQKDADKSSVEHESQLVEVKADNAPKDTKSDADLKDISLPNETKLKPIHQSLIEAQKNVLEKVSSNKPLKDKNWSESIETCDMDIEELELGAENPNFFPHPSSVTPPRDLTVGDNEGNSLIAPNPGSCYQDIGGDRYGGLDRGPSQRSRDPPMARGRDYSPSPRDFGRGAVPDRMSRGSARDFQATRYDHPQRDFSPSPREFHSSRDLSFDRGPTSRDRMSARDYGSPQASRDFGGGMSRGGSSLYAGSREQSMGSRDVYIGGRDRDLPPSRDYISSREFSSRGGSSRGGLTRGGGDFERGQPMDDYRDSGRGGPPSRGPSSRVFSGMGSQRDSGRSSQDMYDSTNRGQSRGGPPSNRGPPSRGPPPRGVASRGPPPRDDRDRGGYSTGQRRPSNMDSRGGPPMKRARPSGMSSRGAMRR